MLVAAAEVAHDDADLSLADDVMQVFHISDRGGLDERSSRCARGACRHGVWIGFQAGPPTRFPKALIPENLL